jgi:NADP-dependent 3-hydroxy acid dehydrogenase YdfG
MARQLAARGWRVAVTGRREGELAETARLVEAAGADCLVLAGSVAERETVQRHYAAIRAGWQGLDWAILNAGLGERTDARAPRAEDYARVFATNVGGAVNWLEAVVPDMVAAGRGTIAGISSLAAWRGLPRAGAYSGSKAALAALLESARVDLRGTGVRVVTVFPGFVKNGSSTAEEDAGKPFLLELEDGVRRILDGIAAGRPLVHFPFPLSHFMKYVGRNLPVALYDWLIGRMA